VYVEQLGCSLRGELNVAAFERAWQRVVDHHPVLRTAFVWEGMDEPVQVVQGHSRLSIEHLDWRAIPPGSRNERWEEFLQTDRRRGFDLSRAPLMRIALIRTEKDVHRFVWTHHHLLLDGWSIPLLLNEIFSTYDALCRGEEPVPAKIRPYQDYIAWLRKQDRSAAESYWRRTLKGLATPTPLVIDRPSAAARPGTSWD